MRFFYFFISLSIFVSCCAVALCTETFLLLHRTIDFDVLGFLFFSTLCSYNFYWLISKFYFNSTTTSFLKNNISNTLMLLLGGVGAVYFFILGSINFYVVLFSAFLTLLYSVPLWPFSFSKKIQQLGFAKTILLAFTWAFVTVMLPICNQDFVVSTALHLFIIRFLFMLLLCIIFDKRDIVIDKMHGLQTLATKIKATTIKYLYAFILICYLIFSIYFFRFSPILSLVQTFLITGFLWFAYVKSLQKRGYLFYYFFIDGLMLVSLFFNFIAQIKF